MTSAEPLLVVAGVIERSGRILIAQRRRTGRHPLKWEFPGGKVEPGEDPRRALQRELREELGIRAALGAELGRYDVRYGSGPLVRLLFYEVTSFEGEPRNLDFEQILWERRLNLAAYDFLEGDVEFVRRLAGGL
jgi:8-oxo-dGTP diphosphatase